MPLRICAVSFADVRGIRHAVEVQAESLFEAAILGVRIGAPPKDEKAGVYKIEAPHRYIAYCAARPGRSYPVVQRYQSLRRDDHAIHRRLGLGR